MNRFFCRRCGTELLEDSLFCDKCGTKVITLSERPSAPARPIVPVSEQNNSKTNVITHQQYVEAEYLHQTQIRQELNDALQKRKVAALAEEKKKKTIEKTTKILVIIAVSAIVLAYIMKSVHNAELRNFATETMNGNYTNVYVDVVSMEPEYFVYNSRTTSGGAIFSNTGLRDVVCRCKTVEGKTVWVSFFYHYYPEGNYSPYETAYKAFTYSYDKPLRLIGHVDTARQIVDELEDAIGNVFVLDVKEKPKQ